MEAATKKKRGRPRVFTGSELYEADETGSYDRRTAANRVYCNIGLGAVFDVINPDIDPDNYDIDECFGFTRTKRAGVLEQLGRMVKAGYSETELKEIILQTVQEIRQGEKSKDIEYRLRQYRLNTRAAGNSS